MKNQWTFPPGLAELDNNKEVSQRTQNFFYVEHGFFRYDPPGKYLMWGMTPPASAKSEVWPPPHPPQKNTGPPVDK